MPRVGKQEFPYSKAGERMAKQASGRTGKPITMAKRSGISSALGTAANRGTASANIGRGIKADRGRTAGSTWTKKGMK